MLNEEKQQGEFVFTEEKYQRTLYLSFTEEKNSSNLYLPGWKAIIWLIISFTSSNERALQGHKAWGDSGT